MPGEICEHTAAQPISRFYRSFDRPVQTAARQTSRSLILARAFCNTSEVGCQARKSWLGPEFYVACTVIVAPGLAKPTWLVCGASGTLLSVTGRRS